VQGLVIPGKIGQKPPLKGHRRSQDKNHVKRTKIHVYCSAEQHHKMGVPDMLPGIGEMLGIVHKLQMGILHYL
jgi:hypothetical protein